ncbi:hypothetical protein L1049_004643 [Liquidambar formosana]|uniref:At1g68980-like TPR repeats domain-containing protein n=1 Tax=Liquidambar formosana TaxID=63359 RepID=A0AAP0WVW0_LIQFO
MLSIRKLSYHITEVSPSALFSLVACSTCNTGRVSTCQFKALGHRSICQFTGSPMTNINMRTVVLEFQDGFIRPIQSFSTTAGTILVQARDAAKLCLEIQNAIDEHRFDDTWKLYEQHMQMEGFPRKFIVNKLLTSSAESLDLEWLEKAYGLVERAFEESKQNLFEKETLIYLSFGLARCGLPVPASTVLRKLVEMEQFPPVTAWSAILAHMSQTAPGAYLAAELILEIGYLFQDGRVDPRKKSNRPLISMKPSTIAFNIALAGCLLFGTTKKAEHLLEMMPRVGVRADANLLIIMAHIYGRNGRRDELKKLERHIHEAHNLNDIQFRQFYNCLLTCHLKFGDLDSASNMVLEMLRKAKEARNSLTTATFVLEAVGNGKTSPPGQCIWTKSEP